MRPLTAIGGLESADFDLLIVLQCSFADSSMAVEIAASHGGAAGSAAVVGRAG